MYDLRVVVEEVKGFCDLPMKPGDYFEVKGGRITIPEGKYMCLWALQSMMPLLPLKQRRSGEENDWVADTARICCPDPNGMVIYRIEAMDSGSEQPVYKEEGCRTGPKPRILVDGERCTGCRACETICSFVHQNSFCGENSRIRVDKDELQGSDIPGVCRQCGNAPCVDICPAGALSRDPGTMAVIVDEDKCTGCRICAGACPFDGIHFHNKTGRAVVCDLCGGDPQCVKRCPVEAIKYGKAENFIK